MLEHDERRNYIRMEVDCEVLYKLPNANEEFKGQCTTLSGSGVSFIAEKNFEAGIAMEIQILPKNAMTPPMNAFIEIVRTSRQEENKYLIAASIKSIKGG